MPLTHWWFPDHMLVENDLKVLTSPPYNKEQYQIQGLKVSQAHSSR